MPLEICTLSVKDPAISERNVVPIAFRLSISLSFHFVLFLFFSLFFNKLPPISLCAFFTLKFDFFLFLYHHRLFFLSLSFASPLSVFLSITYTHSIYIKSFFSSSSYLPFSELLFFFPTLSFSILHLHFSGKNYSASFSIYICT